MNPGRWPSYRRAPSPELQRLLDKGGFLASLPELNGRKVCNLELDVHFRLDDEIQVYCGLTRILCVKLRSGPLDVTAHQTYTSQPCANGLFRQWRADESGFSQAIEGYLNDVKVNARHTGKEGAVQTRWSQVISPWTPFDREAVLAYKNERDRRQSREFSEVKNARDILNKQAQSWAKLPRTGGELDQIAVDPEGRLVLIELKDTSSTSDKVYYAPFQLLQYVWEWHSALENRPELQGQLQALIDARVKCGLTSHQAPQLAGGIRAAVGFGRDTRSIEVKRRYNKVLDVVNCHLPSGIDAIETWEYTNAPCQIHRESPRAETTTCY